MRGRGLVSLIESHPFATVALACFVMFVLLLCVVICLLVVLLVRLRRMPTSALNSQFVHPAAF